MTKVKKYLSKNDKYFLTFIYNGVILHSISTQVSKGTFDTHIMFMYKRSYIMKEQKRITYWLKGVTISIALIGLAFFGGFTLYAFKYKPDINEPLPDYIRSNVVMIWITAVLLYAILYFFWRIVSEIGRDNSFSMENVKNFKYMAFLGGLICVEYLIRIALWLIKGDINGIAISYTLLKIVAFGIFIVLCLALSRLVKNAYDIKSENDLTI